MKKFIRGFFYAAKGIRQATATQLNFRVHLAAALLALIAGYALKISPAEWLWVALCIGMVLAAELFNTAIELLTDLASPGYHKKAGMVKDMAAAAVLITALMALVIGLVIFLPKLVTLFHHAA